MRTRYLPLAVFLLSSATAGADELPWFAGSFSDALNRAHTQQARMLVYFWVDGSQHCQNLYAESLQSTAVVDLIKGYVCYSADAGTRAGTDLIARYQIDTLPTVLVLTPKGRVDDAFYGYLPAMEFQSQMQRVQAGQGTVSALRAAFDKNRADSVMAWNLAMKLDWIGRNDECLEVLRTITARDPAGRTEYGARVLIWEIAQRIQKEASDPTNIATFDLSSMYDYLSVRRPSSILFQGWNWVQGVESAKGDREKARQAYAQAWRHVPDDQQLQWGSEMIFAFWRFRDELKTRDRRFVIKASRTIRKLARAREKQKLDEKEKRQLSYAFDALGYALHIDGKPKKAIAMLKHAMKLDPDSKERAEMMRAIEGAKS